MQYPWKNLIYRNCKNIWIQNESKRYAGHSKWKNIKHTKESQDQLRSTLFRLLANKMKIAAIQTGDPNPTTNHRLASLVAESKKHNMPTDTLQTILNRLKTPLKGETYIITLSPSVKGVILILYIITDNIGKVRPIVNNLTKRFKAKVLDNEILSKTFDCASYITVSKDCNLNQAMEDAITIDAQDIEQVDCDNDTYFVFKSEFLRPEKIKTQLETLGYTILSIENKATPLTAIDVTEEELQYIDKFKNKLEEHLNEIIKIDDNIDLS